MSVTLGLFMSAKQYIKRINAAAATGGDVNAARAEFAAALRKNWLPDDVAQLDANIYPNLKNSTDTVAAMENVVAKAQKGSTDADWLAVYDAIFYMVDALSVSGVPHVTERYSIPGIDDDIDVDGIKEMMTTVQPMAKDQVDPTYKVQTNDKTWLIPYLRKGLLNFTQGASFLQPTRQLIEDVCFKIALEATGSKFETKRFDQLLHDLQTVELANWVLDEKVGEPDSMLPVRTHMAHREKDKSPVLEPLGATRTHCPLVKNS